MNPVQPADEKKQSGLIDRFVNKSIEAFILGLEVFNKPTIRYRIEGFSFFICNAWELMLKARLLKEGKEITFPKNPKRSIDLSTTIGLIYTNNKDPLRLNLEKIIELRNTSTHYVTEDYETIYAPFFQANVFNFSEQINRFHNIDITKHISQNFLTLSVSPATLTTEEIEAKYTPDMALKLIQARDDANYLMESSGSNGLYVPVRTEMYVSKDPKHADFAVSVNSNADNKIRIVKELKDPNDTHRLSFKNVIDAVNGQIKAKGIPFGFRNNKGISGFNTYCLTQILKFYGLKTDERYTFAVPYSQDNSTTVYKYSHQLVDFIVDAIQKDSDLIDKIKSESKKKIAPGAKDSKPYGLLPFGNPALSVTSYQSTV